MWYLIVSIPDLCNLTYFNDNIYHDGNISKMPDVDGFFLIWNVKNVKVDLMVNVKMATLSANFVLKNA